MGESVFAWRPVAAIGGSASVLLLALSPRYGYHRDELYFRMLGERPFWGYVDTPPLTPLIARAQTELFGESVTALRVVPALLAGLTVVLVALLARELGGGRPAQLLAAGGFATTTLLLIGGHSLLTFGVDLPFWTAAFLLAVRALRGDGRSWIWLGLVLGLATYNRQLVTMMVITVVGALVVAGPREVLRDRRFWAGAAIAVVVALPNLLYQASHDWPQFTMARALEEDDGADNRMIFLPLQFLLLGPPQAVLQIAGGIRMWREPALRCLVLAYPLSCMLTLMSGGRADYVSGFLVLFFAAGCVPAAAWLRTRAKRAVLLGALAVNAVLSAVMALPLIPVGQIGGSPVLAVNEVAAESIGWPSVVRAVSAAVDSLPEAERARAILLTDNYGEAGALDRFREEYRLPPVYSGHNELYHRGPPPDDATVAVIITDSPLAAERFFGLCVRHGQVDNGVDVDNEEQGLPVLICRDPREPWSRQWTRFQHHS